jgi:hypothetical protein
MKLQNRELYCPHHFGNAYEAMWPREMAAYLNEMSYWGFNRYSDVALPTTDNCNPAASDAFWNMAMELGARKKEAYRHATEIGLKASVTFSVNHVFLDQLRPDLLATKGSRIIGQLICPSIPEARAIIIGNYETVFRDWAKSGIDLSAFSAFAYDYGGCACDKCSPWILTCAKLVAEIHDVALRYFPDIEPWMVSWWWNDEEHRQLIEWAERERPNWLRAIVGHIKYGDTRFADSKLPAGCTSSAFIHGGYGDVAKNRDVYSKLGACIAAKRLPQTLTDIAEQGAAGYQFYSEGIYDDVNKAIVAALSSGKAGSIEEVLHEYAARYFGAKALDVGRWARWLAPWGDRAAVPLEKAAAEFKTLSARATPGWRLEHWRSKLELEAIDRKLAREDVEWTTENRTLADDYFAANERLQRDVYRLGPVRHILTTKASAPPWYQSWLHQQDTSPTPVDLPGEA